MKYVKVSQEGPVSVVVFESGPKNYFGLDLIVELAEAFERIDQQPCLLYTSPSPRDT